MFKRILTLSVALLFSSIVMKAQQWNGYFLTSAKNSTSATLYDTSWNVYKTWTGLTGSTGYSAYLMPGGYLWRAAKATSGLPAGAPGGPICGRITKHDYNGTLLWDYKITGVDFVSHHDIRPMPNGNVLAIVYEKKTATQIAAVGGTLTTMWPDKIIEIQQTGLTTGTIVWEWHAWDHLMQNTNSALSNYVSNLADHPELLNINANPSSDWLHTNGVDYNPMLDQISWSSHNQHEWYIIDHSTTSAEAASHTGGNSGKGGDILYRWGNPQNYGAGNASNKILNVTHDAHWADEFSTVPGRLCGYNNAGVSNNQSTADQIITPINGYNYTITAGSAFLPATYTHRNTVSGMYSSNEGGTQQLPNGNELVASPVTNMIREFNAAGAVIFSHSASASKTKKYSACYITNEPPAIPTVTANGNVLSSSSASTYQWYLNGQKITGATNQSYAATQSGNYLVRITDVNGCVYQYSPSYKLEVFPANVVDINFADNIEVYPNPTSGLVNITNISKFGKEFTVQVISSLGNILKTFQNAASLDLSSLLNGHYYIRIINSESTVTKQISINK
jgi:hypothetical protein